MMEKAKITIQRLWHPPDKQLPIVAPHFRSPKTTNLKEFDYQLQKAALEAIKIVNDEISFK